MIALCAALSAHAGELELPLGANALANRDMPFARYDIPVGPWRDGAVAMELAEGRVLRRTWRINGGQTTLQVFDPLRSQIETQGYEVLFQCHDVECGGFDFRFAVDVVPAPDMAVDFGDYLFLSAKSAAGDFITLLVSRFGRANFVQLVEIGTGDANVIVTPTVAPQAEVSQPTRPQTQADTDQDLTSRLISAGHAVLAGLEFQSGSTTLAQERYESLDALATFMEAQPEQRILLVGHTDTVGNLAPNTALSRARSEAVMRQLQQVYGVDRNRMEAAGAGYMAPLTTNQDAAGREINRRVEVVLLPPK
ncbi:OmpA family protein [Epibacterium ulvae]|uniref:OmpA family protein n=1 Tax=Epibacterium ulvae TaxID=1156985 RepID=UPI001BFC4DEE|nr:OmpA family protein [Epibacterium ulvae]MBT8153847.1 OmpA family protein [Epibacterium ulvae]